LEASSEIREIDIFSNTGVKVFHQSGLFSFESRIDISHFIPGIYFVHIKLNGNQSVNSKLIVR
jgi:hypothetical protein